MNPYTPPVTYKEMGTLFERWMSLYEDYEKSTALEIIEYLKSIGITLFSKLFAGLIRKRKKYRKLILSYLGVLCPGRMFWWAHICAGLGIEQINGSILEKDAMSCLKLLSESESWEIFQLLGELEAQINLDFISDQGIMEFQKLILTAMTEFSFAFFLIGKEKSNLWRKKDCFIKDNPFIKELENRNLFSH